MAWTERFTTLLLSGCTLGAAAGSLVQHYLFPNADGPFVGAAAGAGLLFLILFIKRRSQPPAATEPQAVARFRPDPFIELVNRPMLVGGAAFLIGSLLERFVFATAGRPFLGNALAVGAFFLVLLAESVSAHRSKDPSTPSPQVPKPAAYRFIDALMGAAAATAIGMTLGSLFMVAVGTNSTFDIYGIAAGLALYGAWFVADLKKRGG